MVSVEHIGKLRFIKAVCKISMAVFGLGYHRWPNSGDTAKWRRKGFAIPDITHKKV